jgi:hypothetical protein
MKLLIGGVLGLLALLVVGIVLLINSNNLFASANPPPRVTYPVQIIYPGSDVANTVAPLPATPTAKSSGAAARPTMPVTVRLLSGNSEAEMLQGKVQVSEYKPDLVNHLKTMFANIPEHQFVDGNKPVCAFLIVNALDKNIKAQCFDTMSNLEKTVANW